MLVITSGDRLLTIKHAKAPVQLGELCVIHEFIVVKTLVAPVILGIDFLHRNELISDFTQTPVVVCSNSQKRDVLTENSMAIAQVVPIYEVPKINATQVCAISVDQESEVDVVDDCAVPNYNAPPNVELPACTLTGFKYLLEQYHTLFCTKPGYTEDAWHYIPTSGNPEKVPPRLYQPSSMRK